MIDEMTSIKRTWDESELVNLRIENTDLRAQVAKLEKTIVRMRKRFEKRHMKPGEVKAKYVPKKVPCMVNG